MRPSACVIDGAAACEDGPVGLFVATSLNHTLIPGSDTSLAIPVQGFSVPTLMSRLGWGRVDVLKIDIEGYESALFADRPAWLSRVNRIIGEVHEGFGFDALRSDLCPLGFTVSALAKPRMFLATRSGIASPRRS